MVNVIVEHEWEDSKKDEAFKVVGNIVNMQKENKLPEGFKLLSVQVIASKNKAICSWEAPGADSLLSLVKQVNPPTRYEVNEAQKIF